MQKYYLGLNSRVPTYIPEEKAASVVPEQLSEGPWVLAVGMGSEVCKKVQKQDLSVSRDHTEVCSPREISNIILQ